MYSLVGNTSRKKLSLSVIFFSNSNVYMTFTALNLSQKTEFKAQQPRNKSKQGRKGFEVITPPSTNVAHCCFKWTDR